MISYSFSDTAIRDLDEICNYIAVENSKAASQLFDKIRQKCKLVLGGRNKASISTAQWLAFISPFKRFRHCAVEILYKV